MPAALLLIAGLLSACSSTGVQPTGAVPVAAIPVSAPSVDDPEPRELPPPEDVWERIRRQLTMHTLHNDRVGEAREHFLAQSAYLQTLEPRAQRYLYFLVVEVERRGMPVELALLPLIESSLNPFALSSQRAAGLWQIMPGTADDLGMRRDWWYDARLDLRDSTRVALDYLEELHGEFGGDWFLALAAYNSGKYRVKRALRRNAEQGLPTDYWSLPLPRETRSYVPRLIALSTLIAFEEALELELPAIPNQPVFTPVETGGQIELLRAAQMAGMTLEELRSYNPGQLRWATAPSGAQELLVPISKADRLREALAALPEEQRVTWEHYRIRQGDSLLKISKRFDTSIDLLRNVNNIRGNLIRAGDTMMIPNNEAWADSLAMAAGQDRGSRRSYTVRKGDSLYVIARRFRISMDDIIAWNRLDPNRYLQPGQSLTLYIRGG